MGFLPALLLPAKHALEQVVSTTRLLKPTEGEKVSDAKTLPREQSLTDRSPSGESDNSSLFSDASTSTDPGSSEGDGTFSRSVSKDFPEDEKMAERSVKQKEEMRMLFNSVDADGDGKVCKKELALFLASLKLDTGVSDVQIQSLLETADENGDNLLEYEEFLKLYESLEEGGTEDDTEALKSENSAQDGEAEEGLRSAFRVFDRNNDGFISASELLLVLQSLNLKSTKKLSDCSHMIKAVDKDGDGKVNFEEFKQMMATGFQ